MRGAAVVPLLLAAAALAPSLATPEPLRLSLDAALALALEQSPELAPRRAESAVAAAELEAARAARRPLLELSGGYTRRSDVREFATLGPDGQRTVLFPNLPDETRGRLALWLPLYTGGRLAGQQQAAGHAAAAAEDELAALRAQVAFETRRGYWSLVAARESQRVLGEALRSFEAHLVDARNRERFGLAARSEVLAVQLELERAELQRIEAVGEAELAVARLARLLGLGPAQTIEPLEPLGAAAAPPEAPDPALHPAPHLVEEAVARRPEHAAARARLAASDAQLGIAAAAARPSLSLLAGCDYANPNRRILPPRAEWEESWDVGVNLSWELFDGGRRAAAQARARARADAARGALRALEQGLRLELREAEVAQRTSAAALRVAERAIESARENQRVAGERHRAGVAPSSERLDAETGLLRAELDRTRAQAGLRIAAARLERALGR